MPNSHISSGGLPLVSVEASSATATIDVAHRKNIEITAAGPFEYSLNGTCSNVPNTTSKLALVAKNEQEPDYMTLEIPCTNNQWQAVIPIAQSGWYRFWIYTLPMPTEGTSVQDFKLLYFDVEGRPAADVAPAKSDKQLLPGQVN